jgi:hypothetical protein
MNEQNKSIDSSEDSEEFVNQSLNNFQISFKLPWNR